MKEAKDYIGWLGVFWDKEGEKPHCGILTDVGEGDKYLYHRDATEAYMCFQPLFSPIQKEMATTEFPSFGPTPKEPEYMMPLEAMEFMAEDTKRVYRLKGEETIFQGALFDSSVDPRDKEWNTIENGQLAHEWRDFIKGNKKE